MWVTLPLPPSPKGHSQLIPPSLQTPGKLHPTLTWPDFPRSSTNIHSNLGQATAPSGPQLPHM